MAKRTPKKAEWVLSVRTTTGCFKDETFVCSKSDIEKQMQEVYAEMSSVQYVETEWLEITAKCTQTGEVLTEDYELT